MIWTKSEPQQENSKKIIMKTLIKNGEIIDGSGNHRYKADLLINGEIIEAINPSIVEPNAKIFDAKGCIVTPGFIDIHRHFDSAMTQTDVFGNLELRQGITSSLCGNCGLSPIPINKQDVESFNHYLKPVTGPISDSLIQNDYVSYSAYLNSVNTRINTGFFAAAGAIAYSLFGWRTRPFTQKERQNASSKVKEAMNVGAKGLTFGIMYQPECWLSEEDHIALASQIREKDGVLCTHLRSEGNNLLSSIEEVIQIARKAKVRLNISHFKATGKKNWSNLIFKAIDIIEKARNEGLPITVDFYPYDGGSTTLLSLIPPTIYPETPNNFSYFSTTLGKQKLRNELQKDLPLWDNMVKNIGWDRIIISSVSHPEFKPLQGLSIHEAAIKWHVNNPSDLLAELIAEDGFGIGVILMSMDYNDVKQISTLPYSCIISDALYGSSSFPHPRLYGTFPKAIRDFTLHNHILTLEEVISKMTNKPAQITGIQNRGLLKSGNFADVLVFDPKSFTDNATYSDPCHAATGMNHVFVNGQHMLQDDAIFPGYFGMGLS